MNTYGERRSMKDRRSGKDRRKLSVLKNLFHNAHARQEPLERRQISERRSGWVRLSKWSSAYLPGLKIAKFLKPREHHDGPAAKP